MQSIKGSGRFRGASFCSQKGASLIAKSRHNLAASRPRAMVQTGAVQVPAYFGA